jgi:deazaflavin-dependent oxidoreductase (nitroreductase family)|nr:nitroreductase/quinone reductase family protein [Nocardioides agariphilus]
MLAWSNQFGVWLYRRTSGAAGGGAAKVLVLTVPGRRTGIPRSTCMAYVETPGGLLVWGSASGASSDPDWFRNLRAAERAEIQVGTQHRTVTPHELRGSERAEAWRLILSTRPNVARYERKAGRTIPVALLAD